MQAIQLIHHPYKRCIHIRKIMTGVVTLFFIFGFFVQCERKYKTFSILFAIYNFHWLCVKIQCIEVAGFWLFQKFCNRFIASSRILIRRYIIIIYSINCSSDYIPAELKLPFFIAQHTDDTDITAFR